MRILWFGLICALTSPAWADEASDRRRALDEIERQVGDIARALSDLPGASSDRKIDDALRSADRVKDKLRDLERVKGDDSKARDVLSRYPRYIDRLKQAKRPLQTLKKHQRALQKWERECQDLDRDLQRAIKTAQQESKPDSARKLQEKAKDLGRKVEQRLRDVERQKQEMERAKSDARRFDASDGRWRDAKSRLHSAADRMLSDWRRDYEKGKRACDELKRGERHSKVSRALDELKRAGQKRADLIKRNQETLKQAASRCRGLESSRDASPIQRVRADLRSLKDRIRELSRVQGGDPKAREITQGWPKAREQADKALEALMGLKKVQHSIDKMAQECEGIEAALLKRAGATLKTPNAKSRDALRKMAQTTGKGVKRALEQAEKGASRVRALKDQASRVSGPGEWRTLGGNLKGSAERMADHYTRRLSEAKRACTELSKGERHGEVAQALRRVDEAMAQTTARLKALVANIRALTSGIKAAGAARGERAVSDARGAARKLAAQLEALKRSEDPRSQAAGKRFSAFLPALNAALDGLGTLKQHEIALEPHVEVCAAADKRLEGAAKQAKTAQPLEALEQEAEALAAAARGHLSEADALARKMRAAHAEALKFNLTDRPWDETKAALKRAADQAHAAFTKSHDGLKDACEEVREGKKHKAIAEARAALEKAQASAKREMDSAEAKASGACDAVGPLITKRDKRAKALKFYVDKVLEEEDTSVKSSSIESLKASIARTEEAIEDATQRCAEAMEAWETADTAWEALYDR